MHGTVTEIMQRARTKWDSPSDLYSMLPFVSVDVQMDDGDLRVFTLDTIEGNWKDLNVGDRVEVVAVDFALGNGVGCKACLKVPVLAGRFDLP